MTQFKYAPKKVGLAALLEAQKNKLATQTPSGPTANTNALTIQYISASDAPEKIRIIFDDSGSMSGKKIQDAIMGCEEFMRNCVPNSTAVAVHPMNYDQTNMANLSTDLPALATLVQGIFVSGSTPMFRTLKDAQSLEPRATRYIVFSDGAPDFVDEKNFMDTCIETAIQDKTPIDTVLITTGDIDPNCREYQILKNLAEKTGGFFLVFDRNKVDFKHAFGYLAPVQRLALASESFREELQSGKV